MVVLITGASHTGKTVLAQRLLKKYHYPYLSMDHLKMGLIRAGHTQLTPESDRESLTAYLWPIVREIVRTAIENGQNLTVEGCYIPVEWEASFTPEYRAHIRFFCLVMSERYIGTHFDAIRRHASIVEARGADTDCTPEALRRENAAFRTACERCGKEYILIDEAYHVPIDLQ